MQYRHISTTNLHNLPEHTNLLRNFQDMHTALTKISNDFPVSELGSVVPNYEIRYNNLILKGNKLISKYKIVKILYKLDVDLTVGGFSAEKLLARKEKLTETLECTIDKWQSICDEIDKIGEPEDEWAKTTYGYK